MIGARSLVVLMVVVSAGGCASASTPTLANRFVRQGTPAVDLGGPRPSATRRPRDGGANRNAGIAHGVARMSSSIASVEATNPGLRDALFRATLAPTTAHYLQVARVYRSMGIMDSAYDYLSRSLSENGPSPEVHDALARLWRDWGHPGVGLSDAYQAVYLAPSWPVAHNTLGTLLYKLGLREEARARFEKSVDLDPGAAYALENLCVLSLAEGRTRDAITQCRQAEHARAKPAHKTRVSPTSEPRR